MYGKPETLERHPSRRTLRIGLKMKEISITRSEKSSGHIYLNNVVIAETYSYHYISSTKLIIESKVEISLEISTRRKD